MNFNEMAEEELKEIIRQANEELENRYKAISESAVEKIHTIVTNYCNITGHGYLDLPCTKGYCDDFPIGLTVTDDGRFMIKDY